MGLVSIMATVRDTSKVKAFQLSYMAAATFSSPIIRTILNTVCGAHSFFFGTVYNLSRGIIW